MNNWMAKSSLVTALAAVTSFGLATAQTPQQSRHRDQSQQSGRAYDESQQRGRSYDEEGYGSDQYQRGQQERSQYGRGRYSNQDEYGEQGRSRRGRSSSQDEYGEQSRYGRGRYSSQEEYGEQGRYEGRESREGLQQHRLSGRILTTKQVRIPGMEDAVTVALVRTNQGRRYIAILGPTEELSELGLQRGHQVAINGLAGQMKDHNVIFANRVSADGHTARIHDGEEMRPQWQRLTGQVVSTREVELPGMDDPVLLAQVRSNQGRQCLVCLGPAHEVEGLDVRRGERISARGMGFQLGNQRCLIAHEVSANGETMNLAE